MANIIDSTIGNYKLLAPARLVSDITVEINQLKNDVNENLLTSSSERIDLKQAIVDNLNFITQETQSRTIGDNLLSAQIQDLSKLLEDTLESFQQQLDIFNTDTDSLTELTTTLSSQISQNAATFNEQLTLQANTTQSLADQLTTLSASVENNTALYEELLQLEASSDETLLQKINSLFASVNDLNTSITSSIETEQTVRANADASLAQQIDFLSVELGKANAAIETEATIRVTEGEAVAQRIITVEATVEDNTALIVAEQTARADADSALASDITTLSTTVGDNTTAITTVVESVDGIQGKYAVKVDTNGYVSGFGLISTANDAVPTSEFIITADKFSIAPVASGIDDNPESPFFVLTSPTVIGDVTYESGTYIKNARIANLEASRIDTRGLTIKDSAGNIIFGAGEDLDWDLIKNQPTSIFNENISINSDGTLSGAGTGQVSLGGLGAGPFATLDQITSSNVATYIAAAAIGEAYIGDLSASKITTGQLSADRIDTRGLTIKDLAGNIIFGASQDLDWSYIQNQPSNIFNSNISISSSGTLFGAGGGTVTLGGLGAGNFAFIDRITSSNISTYIASAAIGDAYIANLSASKINAGTLSANYINGGILSGVQINILNVLTTGTSWLSITNVRSNSCRLRGGSAYPGISINNAISTSDSTIRFKLDGSGQVGRDFTVLGTLTPFTGAHRGTIGESVEFTEGEILIDSTIYDEGDISNTTYYVEKSTAANQKGVIGVYNSDVYEKYEDIDGNVTITNPLSDGNKYVNINAVGEGKILICGENGNLERGDLVVTSNTHGVGMKQDDDIIRSYTVAKVRENVTFSTAEEIKLVPCIYLCG